MDIFDVKGREARKNSGVVSVWRGCVKIWFAFTVLTLSVREVPLTLRAFSPQCFRDLSKTMEFAGARSIAPRET